jgi:hypothetical protein
MGVSSWKYREGSMPLNFKTEFKEDYFFVLVEGEYDYPSLLSLPDVILKGCEKHQVHKALVDFRPMIGLPNDAERFHFAEQTSMKHDGMMSVGKIKRCRFAYVATMAQLDRRKFVETVSVNRGMLTIVTSDMDAALTWLVVKQDVAHENSGPSIH